MLSLSREEMMRENQDPPEEIEWGRKMSALRGEFLQELVNEMTQEEKRRKNPPPLPPPTAPQPSITLSGAYALLIVRRALLTVDLSSSRDRSHSQTPS